MKKEPWELVQEQMGRMYQLGRDIAKAQNAEVVSFADIRSGHDCKLSVDSGCRVCEDFLPDNH